LIKSKPNFSIINVLIAKKAREKEDSSGDCPISNLLETIKEYQK
jgi:hypothetical protein